MAGQAAGIDLGAHLGKGDGMELPVGEFDRDGLLGETASAIERYVDSATIERQRRAEVTYFRQVLAGVVGRCAGQDEQTERATDRRRQEQHTERAFLRDATGMRGGRLGRLRVFWPAGHRHRSLPKEDRSARGL